MGSPREGQLRAGVQGKVRQLRQADTMSLGTKKLILSIVRLPVQLSRTGSRDQGCVCVRARNA